MTDWERKYQSFECGCALRRGCTAHGSLEQPHAFTFVPSITTDNTLESELQAAREQNHSLRAKFEQFKEVALEYGIIDPAEVVEALVKMLEQAQKAANINMAEFLKARERIQSLEHFAKANECHLTKGI